MLSNAQKGLLKRAQSEAKLNDGDYRDILQSVAGVRSSTDPRFTDRALDKVLALIEAYFWREVSARRLQWPFKRGAVFQQPGYWKAKNTNAETSRDRFTRQQLSEDVTELEGELAALGYGEDYCAAISKRVAQGRTDPQAQRLYVAALQRTITAKRHAYVSVE